MARVAPQVQNVDPLKPPIRREFYPVDTTITAPQAPQSNGMLQLAQALTSVNPKIQSFLNDKALDYTSDQVAQGRTQAIKSGLAYGEAVKRGLITPDQSPYFQRAWKEIDGQNAGDAFAAQIQSDADSSGVLNSGDPNKLHTWIQGQAQQAMQGMDPDTQAGFMPKLMQAHKQLDAKFRTQTSQNTMNGMLDAVSTQFNNIMDEETGDGVTFDPSRASARLHNAAALPQFAGLSPATTDKLVTQAVVNKAIANRDTDVLDALDQWRPDRMKPGQVIPPIGQTADGRLAIQQATDHIHTKIASDNAQQSAEDERARKAANVKWEQQATAELLKNGSVSKDTLAQANSEGAFDAVKNVTNLTRSLREARDYASPQQTSQAYYTLHVGDYGTAADGTPLTALQWANRQVTSGRFSGSQSQVKDFIEAAQREDETGLNPNADYKRNISKLAGATQDPILGKILSKPEDGIDAMNSYAARMALWAAQAKKTNTFTPDNIRVQSDLEMQKIVKEYSDRSNGLAAPKPPAEGKVEMSPSGTPKLEQVTVKDLQMLSRKDDPQVMRDLEQKYTKQALDKSGFYK